VDTAAGAGHDAGLRPHAARVRLRGPIGLSAASQSRPRLHRV